MICPWKPQSEPLMHPLHIAFLLHQLLSLSIVLTINVGLPLLIYYVLKMYVSILIALVLSGIPPLLSVLVTFYRKRRVDVLGVIFVVSFIVSAILTLISGDARYALLRDSVTTALVGFMFLVTLIPLHTRWLTIRPLTYLITHQMTSEMPPMTWTDKQGEEHSQAYMEWCWDHFHWFRANSYITTSLWAFFLMGEFVARVIMVKSTLTVDQIVLYGNIILICVIVVMTTFSVVRAIQFGKIFRPYVIEWHRNNNFPRTTTV
ncbi:hypothetical protein CLU79DRAFT_737900 [Phycomyces nitens]|nr:hypothetical protein CLU79DRAFT_737900 [Phycomyces nitens]